MITNLLRHGQSRFLRFRYRWKTLRWLIPAISHWSYVTTGCPKGKDEGAVGAFAPYPVRRGVLFLPVRRLVGKQRADPAPRVRLVPLVARDDVDVQVHHRLAGGLAVVDPDVVAV